MLVGDRHGDGEAPVGLEDGGRFALRVAGVLKGEVAVVGEGDLGPKRCVPPGQVARDLPGRTRVHVARDDGVDPFQGVGLGGRGVEPQVVDRVREQEGPVGVRRHEVGAAPVPVLRRDGGGDGAPFAVDQVAVGDVHAQGQAGTLLDGEGMDHEQQLVALADLASVELADEVAGDAAGDGAGQGLHAELHPVVVEGYEEAVGVERVVPPAELTEVDRDLVVRPAGDGVLGYLDVVVVEPRGALGGAEATALDAGGVAVPSPVRDTHDVVGRDAGDGGGEVEGTGDCGGLPRLNGYGLGRAVDAVEAGDRLVVAGGHARDGEVTLGVGERQEAGAGQVDHHAGTLP